MNMSKKNYLFLALFFLLGVIAALAADRVFLRPSREAEAAVRMDPGTVNRSALADFLDAAKRKDYEAMGKKGDEVFRKGVLVPDSGELFKDYAANSYPPYTVYAFYSEGSDDRVRRVLLTLDAEERVESFLAEEMTVIQ